MGWQCATNSQRASPLASAINAELQRQQAWWLIGNHHLEPERLADLAKAYR